MKYDELEKKYQEEKIKNQRLLEQLEEEKNENQKLKNINKECNEYIENLIKEKEGIKI